MQERGSVGHFRAISSHGQCGREGEQKQHSLECELGVPSATVSSSDRRREDFSKE